MDKETFEKEDKECVNKDKNGNACWNCEAGEGKCGTADKETFEEWEKENEDDLVDSYLFDIDEMTRGMDYTTIKNIVGYWEHARGSFDNRNDE